MMEPGHTTNDGRDLSFAPVTNPHPKRLTPEQIAFHNENGYVKPFRVYDEQEAVKNREYFDWLLAEVQNAGDGRNAYSINAYHVSCRGIYDMAVHPTILDHVEDLLGPDFVCWGTHFFCKLPHDPKEVSWHQDASFWPFTPARTVTVWLAIDDADEENAALQFVPGTHALGPLEWKAPEREAVLDQEIAEIDQYGQPVVDALRAGEMSLHADMLAHGSPANASERRRSGLTLRYCPTYVRCVDNEPWNRQSILCRGSDPENYWAHLPRPEGEDPSTKAMEIGGN